MRISKLLALTLLPSAAATAFYVVIGRSWQGVPSMALFFLVCAPMLSLEIGVILAAARREFGACGLRAALDGQRPMTWRKTLLYALALFAFAGLMGVTVAPLEQRLTAGLAAKLPVPPYFDWEDPAFTRRYPRGVLVFTCALYLVFNVIIAPAIEELYFRGYLTRRLSRFGGLTPVIVTVVFSLCHWWLPFANLFRVCAFLPAAIMAYRTRNIRISMLFHSFCNLFSTVSLIAALPGT